jgi:hypothetical protein
LPDDALRPERGVLDGAFPQKGPLGVLTGRRLKCYKQMKVYSSS